MTPWPVSGARSEGLRSLVQVFLRPDPSPAAFLDDAAVDLALAESLGALLGARVAEGRIAVRPDRRAALVAEYHRCRAANFARGREVASLLEIVGDRAIPIVLLKGMALIQSTFGEGERSMGDVDVLVPASRWAEICDKVIRAGWRAEDLPGRAYTVGHDYVRSFTTGRGATIEIHRFVCEESLFAFDYAGAEGIFARARRLPSGLSVPDDNDLFLTLAAHAAKHTFDLPLRSFLDGIFLLERSQLRLGEAAARARSWRMAVAFRMWLSALSWLAPDRIDESIAVAGLGQCEPTWIGGVRARVGSLLWSRTTHVSPWQRFLRLAWLTDSPLEWARHVATRTGLRAIDLVDGELRRRFSSGPGT